jgi:hypothetical protein
LLDGAAGTLELAAGDDVRFVEEAVLVADGFSTTRIGSRSDDSAMNVRGGGAGGVASAETFKRGLAGGAEPVRCGAADVGG